ncbi:MAG TPA: cache domain-containing protein, partial [Pseudomonas sp.]|nr:cache domain-containing protein [Pseudomonas sp.]
MTQNLKFSHKILLAASLVVIVAFSLFTLYNDYLQRNAIRADLEDELKSLGSVTASNIQSWLSGRILMTESLAQSIDAETTPDALGKLLGRRAFTNTFVFTYLGSADGVMTMHPNNTLPENYDPRTRPWYKDAMAAGGSTLTEPYVDAATGALIMTIATPAGSNGVIGGDLSLETLVQIINSLDFGGMGYAFLISADGKILVHPNKDQVMKNLKDIYPQNTPIIGDAISEGELDGKTRILTFTKVKGLPSVDWYIGLSIDKDKAYASLTGFRTSAVIATLVAVFSIMVLLSMLIRVLMQPLHTMGRTMR